MPTPRALRHRPPRPRHPDCRGRELRNAQKELASVTRKMEKTTGRIDAVHARFAAFDQSDYEGLGALSDELRLLHESLGALESRWLEVSQALES